MKCVVNLKKMSNHVIDIEEGTTIDEVIEIVTQRQKALLSHGCSFEIVPSDGSRIPVAKDKPISLKDMDHEYFRLVAGPKKEWPVIVHGSFLKSLRGAPNPRPLRVIIEKQYTVEKLKEELEKQTGLPAELQHICHRDRRETLDNYTVFSHGILKDDHLYVHLKFTLSVGFESKFHKLECWSDEGFGGVLLRFLHERDQDASDFRFLIGKATGKVDDCAMAWLPERDCLFEAESAVGSVEENGLSHGDKIHVLGVNLKRKRKRDDANRDAPTDREHHATVSLRAHDVDDRVAGGANQSRPRSQGTTKASTSERTAHVKIEPIDLDT